MKRDIRQSKGLHYLLRGLLIVPILCAPLVARAQDARGRGPGPAAPPAPKNLQVLPKDTPPQEVLARMQQFTRALGVQCTYCHVEQTAPLLSVEEQLAAQAAAAAAPPVAGRGRGRGRGGPQMDYAADDRRTKRTARLMLAMTNDINARLAASVSPLTGRPAARVECATCHRGVTIPAQLSDLLRQTMVGKGEGAAVAQYRELRQQYLNTGAYNFQETTLRDLGRESLATHKPDDALAWLQLNAEFYPKSAATYVEMAKAHVAKRDPDAAKTDLSKALAIDPANADAKRELARLQ